MMASSIKTTIFSALLLLSLLSRQGALLLHRPHKEVSRCELIKTKSDKGICHFHESAVKCALCELITQPVQTFSAGFVEFRFIAYWPKESRSFILQETPIRRISEAPNLRGPPAD